MRYIARKLTKQDAITIAHFYFENDVPLKEIILCYYAQEVE